MEKKIILKISKNTLNSKISNTVKFRTLLKKSLILWVFLPNIEFKK